LKALGVGIFKVGKSVSAKGAIAFTT
jgi:hypothetical protein